jgi:hypothetical protein
VGKTALLDEAATPGAEATACSSPAHACGFAIRWCTRRPTRSASLQERQDVHRALTALPGHDWPLALCPGGYECGPPGMTMAGCAANTGKLLLGRPVLNKRRQAPMHEARSHDP